MYEYHDYSRKCSCCANFLFFCRHVNAKTAKLFAFFAGMLVNTKLGKFGLLSLFKTVEQTLSGSWPSASPQG